MNFFMELHSSLRQKINSDTCYQMLTFKKNVHTAYLELRLTDKVSFTGNKRINHSESTITKYAPKNYM